MTRRAADAVAARGGLIALIGGCLTVQPLSTDLYLPSLPGLVGAFGTTIGAVQLTLSLFVIGFGTAQLVVGPLSDRLGRKPVLLGGLALYAFASLVCALAPTIDAFIAGRVLQSFGCCTAIVVGRAIIRDAFDPAAGARAMARASTINAAGPIIGPIIGAWLEVRYGHRAAFVALCAYGALLCFATWRWFGESLARPDPAALDPRRLAATYARVLRDRVFLAYTALGAASYAGLFAFISGSSFVLIRVLGVATTTYGLVYALVVCGYLGGTIVARRMLPQRGLVRTMLFGGRLALTAALLLAATGLLDVRHPAALLVPAFLFFAAHGIVFPGAMAGGIAPFPGSAGAAAGLFGFLAMAVAAGVGWWIGASHDGTMRPLALTIAVAGAAVFAILQGWLRRVDRPSAAL